MYSERTLSERTGKKLPQTGICWLITVSKSTIRGSWLKPSALSRWNLRTSNIHSLGNEKLKRLWPPPPQSLKIINKMVRCSQQPQKAALTTECRVPLPRGPGCPYHGVLGALTTVCGALTAVCWVPFSSSLHCPHQSRSWFEHQEICHVFQYCASRGLPTPPNPAPIYRNLSYIWWG